MFIELAEYLRCPGDHEDTYCVVTTDRMVGRDIVAGTIGCPVCRREFPIVNGVARLTETDQISAPAPPPGPPPEPSAVAALLNLSGAGGYVVLVGSAAGLAGDLEAMVEGVHFVAVNAPAEMAGPTGVSRLEGEGRIPVRSNMARGVVLGGEIGDAVSADAVRVVLRGLRVVRLAERALPEGLRTLATGQGMAVGEKV